MTDFEKLCWFKIGASISACVIAALSENSEWEPFIEVEYVKVSALEYRFPKTPI